VVFTSRHSAMVRPSPSPGVTIIWPSGHWKMVVVVSVEEVTVVTVVVVEVHVGGSVAQHGAVMVVVVVVSVVRLVVVMVMVLEEQVGGLFGL
jgi:hypothetical protein